LDDLDEDYICFYHCGPASGASILHKHIQLLPFDARDMGDPDFPFIYTFKRFDASDPVEFCHLFKQFLTECLESTGRSFTGNFNGDEDVSYNVLFTRKWLLIVPRTRDAWSNDDVSINVNSVGFAKALLVKNEQAFEIISRVGPMNILCAVIQLMARDYLASRNFYSIRKGIQWREAIDY
jgi:sulfate adenylyltransferase (ADP) / ATP adenylyltransferase